MSTLTLRVDKGGLLTYSELDTNFDNLNTDKLENVVEDLTPQLGGNLDLNGNKITEALNDTVPQIDNGVRITKDVVYFWNTYDFSKGVINNIVLESPVVSGGTYYSSPSNIQIPLQSLIGDNLQPWNANSAGIAGLIGRNAWWIGQMGYPDATSLLPAGTAYDSGNPIPNLGAPFFQLQNVQMSCYPDFPEVPGLESSWHTCQYQVDAKDILFYDPGFANQDYQTGIIAWNNSKIIMPHALFAKDAVYTGYSNAPAGGGVPCLSSLTVSGVIPKIINPGQDSSGLYDGSTTTLQFDMTPPDGDGVWVTIGDQMRQFGAAMDTEFRVTFSNSDYFYGWRQIELLQAMMPSSVATANGTDSCYRLIDGVAPSWFDTVNNKVVMKSSDLIDTTTGVLIYSWRMKNNGYDIVYYDFKVTEVGNATDATKDVDVTIVTTTPTSLTAADKVVIINKATAGAHTINLEDIALRKVGRSYTIKDGKGDAHINPITINAYTGQTIDGQTSVVINTSYSSVTIVNNGTEWNII